MDEPGWEASVSKLLKLTSSISIANMHAFNSEQKLRKFDSLQEIVDEFMTTRFKLYARRKSISWNSARQK